MGEIPDPVANSTAFDRPRTAVRSNPFPITGETSTSAPTSSAQISPAVAPLCAFTSSSTAPSPNAHSPGALAMAMNAALPSSRVRICKNCPGVAYAARAAVPISSPIARSSASPARARRSFATTEALDQAKSFQPARASSWWRARRGRDVGRGIGEARARRIARGRHRAPSARAVVTPVVDIARGSDREGRASRSAADARAGRERRRARRRTRERRASDARATRREDARKIEKSKSTTLIAYTPRATARGG